MRKFIIAFLMISFLAESVYMARFHGKQDEKEVSFEKIGHRKLLATVSASGKLRAHREVEISANTMGRITKLGVREGDKVEAGAFLLMIDPVPFETTIARIKAVISLEKANLRVARASREKAKKDYEREKRLLAKGMAPQERVDTSKLQLEIKEGQVTSAQFRIEQQMANLTQAEHEYSKVRVNSPIAGIVTQLNIEEGENVVTGTMNNPGTVLMKISDLGTLEVELEVDETEVVRLYKGQESKISFDAFPDKEFKGRVEEIAPGPEGGVISASGTKAVRYLVVVTIVDDVPGARIGLSASAEITTAVRKNALAIPISAVTVREFQVDAKGKRIPGYEFDETSPLAEAALDPVSGDPQKKEFQGVFIEDHGLARFEVVKIGIAGDRYFEVLEGLHKGITIIPGPYQKLRELKEGDAIKEKKKRETKKRKRKRRRRRRKRPSPEKDNKSTPSISSTSSTVSTT